MRDLLYDAPSMNKYLVEFIGTFFLVLTIGLVAGSEHLGALGPLAVGSVLLGMIYAGGHVSAAHYNPAVTVAFWMRGKCAGADVLGYWIGQVVGAILAALAVGYLAADATFSTASFEIGPMLVAELLFTFALCWVILNTATAVGTEGNSFYGLAISFTVIAGAYAVGPISGAVFNPAVTVGLCLMGLLTWTSIWVYFIAQFAAAVGAVLVFRLVVKN